MGAGGLASGSDAQGMLGQGSGAVGRVLGLAAVSHRACAGHFGDLSADKLESGVFFRLTG